MLKDLSLIPSIKKNATVRIGFMWSLTRFLIVGNDDGSKVYDVQSTIKEDFSNCKLYH
jgi:hypothetical protein